jgi:3-deoxy-7-phosphoheptulonate synthase
MILTRVVKEEKVRVSYQHHDVTLKEKVAQNDDTSSIIFENMDSPNGIRTLMPMTQEAKETVVMGRNALKDIMDRRDQRLIMVVGPCSIHDPIAGFDYAKRLKKLADELSDTLHIVMRVYFEKPRTTVGWKGFINDPCMNDSSRIDIGIKKARQFLLAVNELGLSVATEILAPHTASYVEDLVSWVAIGARTTESQTHREIASGLQSPVGFKNATNGSLGAAVNGMIAASKAHSFIGMNDEGQSAIIRTKGNAYAHLILRGSCKESNYDETNVAMAEKMLENVGLPQNIMIDCSHGNSSKNYKMQEVVLADIVQQIRNGNQSIVGTMIESNIEEGNQEIPKDLSQLKYGCSVTDGCVDWETTERMLRQTYLNLKEVLSTRFSRDEQNLTIQ